MGLSPLFLGGKCEKMWNITSFNDMQGFMAIPNSVTGGWFWTMMLVAITIITFVITRQKTSSDRAFAMAGFGSWIFGTFMFFLGWINWLIYGATIFMMVISIIAMSLRQEQEY